MTVQKVEHKFKIMNNINKIRHDKNDVHKDNDFKTN